MLGKSRRCRALNFLGACLLLLGTFFAQASQALTVRVDAGGTAYTDSASNTWSADTGFNSSSTVNWGTPAIAGTNDPTLFRTERYGPNLQYSFTLPNGVYQVSLYFAENWVDGTFPNGGIGFRVFSVQANGVTIIPNLDVFAQVGAHAALIKTATVTVSNGQLLLSSPGTTGWFVNAIQITGQSVTDTTPPTVPTGVSATALSSSAIQVSWTASTDAGTGVGGYHLFRGGVQIGTAAAGATSFTDTGRAPSTPYSYTVTAFDLASPANESAQSAAASATTPAAVDTTPPTVPTGLTATALSTSSIALSWNAATDAGTGVGGYHLFRSGVQIATVAGTTSFTDTGRAAGTLYSYTVTAFDLATPANESAPSAAAAATTLSAPDTTPPTVPANVVATALSSTQIQLSWNAATDAGTGVGGYHILRGGVQVGTTVAGTTSFIDTGRAPSTAYSYTVTAFDLATPANESAPSAAASATTLASGTTTTTAVRIDAGGAVYTDSASNVWSADAGFNSSATVNWGAVGIAGTNDPALYRTERYGANLQYSFALPNGVYQVSLYFAENWVDSTFPNGGIGFRVFSVQANGVTIVPNLDIYAAVGAHTALIKTATVTVSNGQLLLSSPGTSGWFVDAIQIVGQSSGADTTPPTVPAGLTATAVNSSSIALSWNAAIDAGTGVGGYHVFRGGVQIATTAAGATGYTDTGRSPSTSYSYTVTAFDLASPANESAASVAAAVTTPAVADTTPPTVPTGLGALPVSSSSIALGWNASSDAGTGVGGYHVFRGGVLIATTAALSLSYTDTGLAPGTPYSYTVTAFDLAHPANESLPSAAVAASTPAAPDTTPPTVPTGLTATAASTSSVALSWTAAIDAGTGVGGYHVFRGGVLIATAAAGATSYTDTGRTPGTTYSYTLTAFDLATPPNESAQSAAKSATTLAAPDLTPPTVPAGLIAIALSSSSVQLSWNAATDAATGVGGYHVFRGGVLIATATASSLGYTDSGLAPATPYNYTVTAFDLATPANESAPSSSASATTLAAGVTAVRIEAGGAAYTDSASNVWSADTGFNGSSTVDWGAVPIAGTNDPALYRTERYGANLQYTFSLPNGVYQVSLYFSENWVDSTFPNGGIGFRVFSVLANGVTIVPNLDIFAQVGRHTALVKTATVTVTNRQLVLNSSGASGWFVDAIQIIGQSVADTTPPTVPNVTAAGISSSAIQLTWPASVDSGAGVSGYHVYRDGVLLATVSTNGYTDTGLPPTTSHTYTVSAFDYATPANESAQSTPVSASTVAFAKYIGKIMPLGDSITEGCCGGYVDPAYASLGYEGYRGPLAALLTQAGYTFTFVGSLTSSGNDGYQHEGHGGFTINQINQNVATWLAAYTPDTVLLLIGTNDINAANPPQPELRLDALVRNIAALRPGIQILVGEIPPRDDDTTDYIRVNAYNQALPAIVAAQRAAGINVALVDTNSVVSTADLSDHIHPGNEAYQRMAQRWYAGIRNLVAPDTLPPSVPTGLTATALSNSSIKLNWNAATDAGTGLGGYRIYRGGVQIATVAASATSFLDTGRTAATTYSYTITAIDLGTPVNESAASAAASATTLTAPDTTPPTVPTGLTANSIAPSSIDLSWTASNDAGAGLGGYHLFRGGVQIATAAAGTTSFTDTGRTAATTYSYTITAFDLATPANESVPSAAVSSTTLAVTDTTPPTVPRLTATALSSTAIQLNWTASTDAGSGVAGYHIYRAGTRIASAPASATSFIDTGRAPGTTYNYTITSLDLAKPTNESDGSAIASATTLGSTTSAQAHIIFRFPQNDAQWAQALMSPPGSYMMTLFGTTENDPSTTPVPGLGGRIAAAQAAGEKVLGTVSGMDSAQPRSVLKARIDLWYATFPNIDGIFLGDAGLNVGVAEGMSYTAYWADIAAYIHAKGGIAVIHPGGQFGTEQDFQTMLASYETLVLYETYVPYVNNQPQLPALYPWMANYQRDRFAVLANGVAPADLVATENYFLAKNVGFLYLTNVDNGAVDDDAYWATERAKLTIP